MKFAVFWCFVALLNIFVHKKMPENLKWFLPGSVGFALGVCETVILHLL